MPFCKHCGACCKWLVIEAAGVDYDADWIVGRRGIARGPYVFLPSRCKFIGKDNKGCTLHGDKKPKYCREWPKQNWDFLKYLGCKYFED
jgi:hypothetical protein